MQLVETKRNDVYAESNLIARKVGAKHADIVLTLNRIIEDLASLQTSLKFPPKFIKEEREYRGQKFTAYLINRSMFSLLMSRLKTKRAKEWFFRFNDAFYEMEEQVFRKAYNKRNDKWLLTRSKSKEMRKDTMDIVKVFIDYALDQGAGKGAKFYYSNITKATYKALELVAADNPKIRDTLETFELFEIILAEDLIQRKLKEYMELGRKYKDIFQSLKKDLEEFHTTAKLLKGEVK